MDIGRLQFHRSHGVAMDHMVSAGPCGPWVAAAWATAAADSAAGVSTAQAMGYSQAMAYGGQDLRRSLDILGGRTRAARSGAHTPSMRSKHALTVCVCVCDRWTNLSRTDRAPARTWAARRPACLRAPHALCAPMPAIGCVVVDHPLASNPPSVRLFVEIPPIRAHRQLQVIRHTLVARSRAHIAVVGARVAARSTAQRVGRAPE